MNTYSWLQLVFYFVVLLLLARPLGSFMARVYQGEHTLLDPVLGPLERLLYRLSGVDPAVEMNWKTYALAMLVFNVVGLLAVYAIQRLQALLPLNPQGLAAVSPDSSWNTAVSFATNTNWQGYGGEVTMSTLSQMLALTVQNFVSAATGMAVLVALIRGIARATSKGIGNFWVDLTRTTLYILLPLAIVVALVLVSQGVVQTFGPYKTVALLQPTTDANGGPVTEQVLALGPAASQIAIKQLGTNGGGFFNVNSAHPFENPTPFSNFVEMLSILVISAALCYTFGKMVGDTRQGWAILITMTLIMVAFLALAVWAEQGGNPAFAAMGVDQTQSNINPGGNMEGKEVRFGIANSALWATATTAASNGSVNSMHDSFMPLGGLVPLFMMQLGEVPGTCLLLHRIHHRSRATGPRDGDRGTPGRPPPPPTSSTRAPHARRPRDRVRAVPRDRRADGVRPSGGPRIAVRSYVCDPARQQRDVRRSRRRAADAAACRPRPSRPRSSSAARSRSLAVGSRPPPASAVPLAPSGGQRVVVMAGRARAAPRVPARRISRFRWTHSSEVAAGVTPDPGCWASVSPDGGGRASAVLLHREPAHGPKSRSGRQAGFLVREVPGNLAPLRRCSLRTGRNFHLLGPGVNAPARRHRAASPVPHSGSAGRRSK